MIYWILKHIVVGPVTRLVFRPWIEGKGNIPKEGPAILASNHLSFSDSIFLPLMVDRRITFPAKQEYFTGKGLKGWLSKTFFTVTGQIPIDRSGGEASLVALRKGLEVLERGELFGIYPEGTRSVDGRLYRGKTGVARLSVAADVPIIPCAMIDTDKAQPMGKTIPNVVRVGVRVGEPIHHPELAGQIDNHAAMRMITDEVMRALQRLSGQEYVDEYASTVKQRLAARARSGMEQAREQAKEGLEHARAGLDQATAGVAEAADKARAGIAEATGRARERIAQQRSRHEQEGTGTEKPEDGPEDTASD